MTTPRTLREQATDELIEKLKAERDSARRELADLADKHMQAVYQLSNRTKELEQLKKDKERFEKALKYIKPRWPTAWTCVDAAMRKET